MRYQILRYKWKQLIGESRLYMVLVFLLFFLDIHISPIRRMSTVTGEKMSQFLFPFLIADNIILLLVLLCFLFLLADSPFIDISMKYVMIRSGKKTWVKAQMDYLLTVCFAFMLFIFFVSILLSFPNLAWMEKWGRILGTLAQTDAGSQFAIGLSPSYTMMLAYKPWEATVDTIIAGTLVLYMFSLLLFFLSLYFSKILALGIVMGEFLIVTTAWRLGTWGTFCFPITWMQMSTVTKNPTDNRPVIWITWIILLGFIAILRIIIVWKSKYLEMMTAEERE